ncbi:MAG: isoprenylcysteine carboxylmethyltransferase family protein [Burkholderiaceae bacterium]|nr:isoprenylcysteine carboxylmethyltransferase family protein [Burkholderiaceae bacterium]
MNERPREPVPRERSSSIDRIELVVPPPAVTLAVGVLMWGLARWLPQLDFGLPARGLLASALALAGVALVAACVLQFRSAGTTVNPTRPARASALVDRGVYRFSRNPIYLGDALILVGWGLWLANFASLAAIALFVVYLNRFQIEPEERALQASFGQAYDAYRARVRRWI